jgi:4-amino-4-deoxy-L-arabinose transferase-like glycosyltransferase
VTKGRRVAAWLLLAAALGLAILGQFYFFRRQEYVWDGVVFHLLAMLCFLLAWRQSLPGETHTARPRRLPLDAWLRELRPRAVFIVLGLFFSFAATLLLRDRVWNQATGDAVILWLLGVASVAAAAAWPSSWPPVLRWDWQAHWRAVSRGTWTEIVSVVGLTLLALTLRASALDSVPYTLGGDEAWFGLTARQVLSGELRNPFVTAFVSMPTLFYWPVSWTMRLLGNNVMGLRLPAALMGTATVPLLYFLTRDLWGRRTALLAAVFLATYDYHIHYSRLGANNIWDPLFVVLVLWVLDLGLTIPDKVQRARALILAGLLMGLSIYFYIGARLLPLLIAVYVVFVWIRKQCQIERLGLHLVLLILAFLVAAGPMLSYALLHPNEWNARINQVGIIQSGWLEREPELTGKSTPQILAEQFLRAAGAFHVFPDRTVWYGADRPLLGFLSGAFAVLGMAWSLAHWRDRRFFLMLVWFWAVIITGGMLTESPPSSQRLIIAIPAVALLVAFGLEQSVILARRLLDFNRTWENVALGLLVAIMAVSSIHFYFVDYTPSRRYGSENGETATMIGHYLRDLDGDYHAYLFGAPRLYWSFGTMPFLAPNVQGQDVVESLSNPPEFVDEATVSAAGRGVVFLFLPERLGELDMVQQALSDGQVREFYDTRGRLRFTAYQVP